MTSWNAAIEFSQVTLHSAPDTLNVVAHAKVSCRVVIGFSGVAKPLYAIVTRMSIRDKMAASSYPCLKEQFNAILLSVGDNLQPQASGVYFYGMFCFSVRNLTREPTSEHFAFRLLWTLLHSQLNLHQ